MTTAVAAVDLVDPPRGPLVFNDTVTRVCVELNATDDRVFRNDRTLTLRLSTTDRGVSLNPFSATVLIQENDGKLYCRG